MPRVEMVLYHGLPATGTIEVSTTSSTGPWTALPLPSSMPVSEALSQWTTDANAALPARGWDFFRQLGTHAEVVFDATGGNAWVKLSPCLADLFGFATTVLEAHNTPTSTQRPLAVLEGGVAIGTTFPTDVEDAELTEYRADRQSAYHYGRAVEVEVSLYVDPDTWDECEASPLLSGHASMVVFVDAEAAWAEGQLDGSLRVYPLETLERSRECAEADAVVRYRCTMRDPEEDQAAGLTSSTTLWALTNASLPYGYGRYYALEVEGIPTVFLEHLADAAAPSGYDLDATLVIDTSAKLGCVVADEDPIARGHDLQVRLLTSTAVDAYFTSPQRYSVLTADLTAAATTASATLPQSWSGLSELYIGPSCIPFSGVSDSGFAGLTRGVYGRARSFRKGTVITDSPSVWQGRRVTLRAVFLDPSGRYVQTSDILDTAPAVWSGEISQRPVRDGLEWVIDARDQVRRLDDPIGVAASGAVVWTPDDDALVEVPISATVRLRVSLLSSSTVLEAEVQPFTDFATHARVSELRAAIVTSLTAAHAGVAEINAVRWGEATPQLGERRQLYQLLVDLNPAVGDTIAEVSASWWGAPGIFFASPLPERTPVDDTSSSQLARAPLYCLAGVVGVGVGVLLDEGSASDIPTTGTVRLEADGRATYLEYTDAIVDTADPGRVNLSLATSSRITGSELAAVLAGERATVSARFLWSDSGGIADILRRALVSTGDAQHGTYDTLPKGQGLGLPSIDEASFALHFGGIFDELAPRVSADAGTSIAKLWRDLFKLSRRSIVTRRTSDGSAVELAAVDLGSVETVVAQVTITADLLVSGRGRRPVRPRAAYRVPQVIEVVCRTLPAGDGEGVEARAELRGLHLTDYTSDRWKLELHGLDRDAALTLLREWARAWFRAGETRQVIELDVPPWVDVQVGDVADLDLPDPALWDYAAGAAGYTGLARVLGAQMDPLTGVQTLTLGCDGVGVSGPMCPSLPILAVAGGATTPTSIDVDEDYYDLLEAARDGGSAYLLAYLPGQDVGTARYTYSGVTLPGGGVARLTISGYPTAPSVSLTTAYRLTWATSEDATTTQARHLHTDHAVQWS